MNTYRCTLIQTINGKKLVKKVFYKKGHTTKEIEENLAMFEWDSKGKWKVEDIDGLFDDEE